MALLIVFHLYVARFAAGSLGLHDSMYVVPLSFLDDRCSYACFGTSRLPSRVFRLNRHCFPL